MRFSFVSALVVALAADVTVASWFNNAAYDKWHETELERWLSDHNIPYPTPADRKDLENLVKNNWNDKVGTPYNSWDTNQLQAWLSSKGQEAKKGTEKNKDSLLSQVKSSWYESEEQASGAYSSVKDWIFDTWTESQLKAFLDYHGIPNPTPRTRDSLLKAARENYQTAANKVGETVSYPGNWLYASWSESDLKSWLDERGIANPQPSSRDKLIAAIRRNSRLASQRAADASASASAQAAATSQYLTDQILDAWSDSQIKAWFDEKGIKVPQGSKRNEMVALARKHRAQFGSSAQSAASSASSYVGAATSSAGNQYAKATDDSSLMFNDVYNQGMSYVNWAMQQVGLAGSSASSAGYSATGAAAKSVSSASSVASKKASSASSEASKNAASASSAASKSAQSVKNEL